MRSFFATVGITTSSWGIVGGVVDGGGYSSPGDSDISAENGVIIGGEEERLSCGGFFTLKKDDGVLGALLSTNVRLSGAAALLGGVGGGVVGGVESPELGRSFESDEYLRGDDKGCVFDMVFVDVLLLCFGTLLFGTT